MVARLSPLVALATLALMVTTGAARPADPGDRSVGVGASTLGATVEATYRITEAFGMRVPVAYLGGSYSDSEDGIDYDLDLTLGGVGILGDFYPGPGGFRLSGGAFYGTIKADGDARGDGTVGNTDYTGVDLAVDVEAANRIMPALAVGYDAAVGSRWMISADLGAMYTGGFDASIRDRTGQVSPDDIAAETRDLEDEAPDFYPYVKLTVAFRF